MLPEWFCPIGFVHSGKNPQRGICLLRPSSAVPESGLSRRAVLAFRVGTTTSVVRREFEWQWDAGAVADVLIVRRRVRRALPVQRARFGLVMPASPTNQIKFSTVGCRCVSEQEPCGHFGLIFRRPHSCLSRSL